MLAGSKAACCPRFLLSRGAAVDAVDHEQHSALHWAIVCWELEALQLLHAAGADPGIPDSHGAGPVHYAVQMFAPGHVASKEKAHLCE